ncbi:unnamed protein product [Heligmosomoides polygyrus]|uniref:Adenylate cyclase-stimulating G alpha protein n=1 Tax=Heligmosomoides polygyrus TaxID=6339 RepID=A0A183FJD0_HELPZ|nr:unnamed protein product [Heligmosomoides polygyrus]
MGLMGCVSGAGADAEGREARKVNKQIEEQLAKDKQVMRATHRLLLLGAGESGKSTIVKQMRILHINGFNEAEKMEKIKDIRRNIRDSMQVGIAFLHSPSCSNAPTLGNTAYHAIPYPYLRAVWWWW